MRSSSRRRSYLLAFAGLSVVTTAAAAVTAGCSKGAGEASVSAPEADEIADTGADVVRRVCPSNRESDGGWVKVDGFDISDYEWVDWDAAAATNPTMKFAFARVSAGLIRNDTRFAFDWPEMKRVGLIRGAYQYFKPSQSAIAQADLFLQRIAETGGLDPTDLPPVLDFETTNGMPADAVVCRVKLWLARVERATKRLPILYSSSQQNDYLGPEMARYPLWVANYVGTPSQTCPRTPDAWPQWTMWQYGGASLGGIWSNGYRDDDAGGGVAHDDAGDGGPIAAQADVNYFDGTYDRLLALVASTASDGGIPDPPLPAHPPHVVAGPDISGPLDCDDGCCILGN